MYMTRIPGDIFNNDNDKGNNNNNSNNPLTKWPPFHRRYFQMHFREWKIFYFIKISLKFVPEGPIDNNPALV